MNEKIKVCCVAFIVGLVIGSAGAGTAFYRERSRSIGELNSRYDSEYGRAAEAISGLEAELERERELNRQLREHNNRARELAEGLADTVERNVRNLQDAIGLIGEIRKKLKVLEDFYADRDPVGSAP
jgi:glucose-6-phosphate-specific signal transduction histidine kinase